VIGETPDRKIQAAGVCPPPSQHTPAGICQSQALCFTHIAANKFPIAIFEPEFAFPAKPTGLGIVIVIHEMYPL
jgi:hypothetical protein